MTEPLNFCLHLWCIEMFQHCLTQDVLDFYRILFLQVLRCSTQEIHDLLYLILQVLRCSNIAVVKVTEITELIHKALENDKQAR